MDKPVKSLEQRIADARARTRAARAPGESVSPPKTLLDHLQTISQSNTTAQGFHFNAALPISTSLVKGSTSSKLPLPKGSEEDAEMAEVIRNAKEKDLEEMSSGELETLKDALKTVQTKNMGREGRNLFEMDLSHMENMVDDALRSKAQK